MKQVKIVLIDDNGTIAPLYKEFEGQYRPQNTYLEIYPSTCENRITLDAEYSSSIGNGGTSQDVFNKKAFRFTVNCCVLLSELQNLANDEKFCKKVNDFVTTFVTTFESEDNESLTMQEQDIDEYLTSLDCAEIYETLEWWGTNVEVETHKATFELDQGEKVVITKETKDEELVNFSKKLEECYQAHKENNVAITQAHYGLLEDLRDNF